MIAQMHAARAGFTVFELLAALALLSVLAGGTLPAWSRLEAALALEAAVRQLAADLHEARALAVASASRVRLVLSPGRSTYRRERSTDAGTFRFDLARTLPRGIRVVDSNSGGTLTYSARGFGENATVVLGDRRGVLRAVRLNQRGRITVLRTWP